MKLLLATRSVDPDAKDNEGRTQLSWAAAHGRKTVVELLLATGHVDPDAKDNNDWPPLRWAARNGVENVVELLAKGTADIR